MAALLALPLALAPLNADAATCKSRKTTGTVLGGVGGAVLGNAVSHGAGGLLIGGLGGAVVGHEIGAAGCKSAPRYASSRSNRTSSRTSSSSHEPAGAVRKVYYDQYGNVVAVQPVSDRR
ncbi:glycine zipper 2TM domain-containing protein [Phenylobacterium sp.]|uniref:glycine zipper 2TM domain-containing protein n=1 Tax=Phenylobacterium sp. TaxID=1871053 RepID=UPI0025E0D6F9|nr:glycine zipper 2TM domain-containing protein [Phenylobacterium sp.]